MGILLKQIIMCPADDILSDQTWACIIQIGLYLL